MAKKETKKSGKEAVGSQNAKLSALQAALDKIEKITAAVL